MYSEIQKTNEENNRMASVSMCATYKQSSIPIINPSLTTLSPFLRAGNRPEFIKRAQMAKDAGATTLHLDIFDPRYVDTGGKPSNMDMFVPDLAAELKSTVGLPIDAHFMVRPSTLGGQNGFDEYLTSFGGAADFISVHIGAFMQDGLSTTNIFRTLERIRAAGASPGVVINPDEGPFVAAELKEAVDFALAMTVIPGDGGRGFDKRGVKNIASLASLGFPKLLAADGAITGETIKAPFDAGARWFVVGSYWFGKEGAYKTLEEMQAAYRSLGKPFESAV